MKKSVFEVIEIDEHYGLDYEISLGLFQNQKDAREYFENVIELNKHGSYKIKVRTLH